MVSAGPDARQVRVGVVGVGKMGISHLSIVGALDGAILAGVVDSADYLLDILHKYTGAKTYKSVDSLLSNGAVDALVIATPTSSHVEIARRALESGVNVFCEKPLTLSAQESEDLAKLAANRGLVAQVGYHNRFVATFREVKRLLDAGAIGRPSHVLAEAYGPVVLRPKGGTWRSRRDSGGGCLYDYAAHPLNLVTWYLGTPKSVQGSVLNSIYSSETDDEVYSTLHYEGGLTAHLSVNWSDESFRKMSTSVTIIGSKGRIYADRQELRAYLRADAAAPSGYRTGWNTRYTTDLTGPVSFYLRGEEYSAQLESFIEAIRQQNGASSDNSFESAAETDRVIEQIVRDAMEGPIRPDTAGKMVTPSRSKRKFNLFFWRR